MTESQPEYIRVDGDESSKLSLEHEDIQFDVDSQGIDSGFASSKEDEDDAPNKDSQFKGSVMNVQSGFSRWSRGGLSPSEYQQMDFETSERDLPYHRRTLDTIPKWLGFKDAKSCGTQLLTVVSILVIFIAGTILGRFVFSHHDQHRAQLLPASTCAATPNWQGWSSIKYAFAFGDSYTSTTFDFQGAQPTPEEPLGNPPFPGSTSSNATNWMGYLTTKYNASALLTYNLAVAGTTLDNHINGAYPWATIEQLYSKFMPKYAEGAFIPWKSSNTLFSIFVGINDILVMSPYAGSQLESINTNLTRTYTKLVSSLYGTGARNFLLLTVPPLERTPYPSYVSQKTIDKHASDTKTYNRRVKQVAGELKTKYDDVNVFVFDSHQLFNEALDDVTRFEQTGEIRNTTGYCSKYALGAPGGITDYFDPACEIPINQYFWINGLHPTYPIHDVLAEHVSRMLEKGPNVC